MRPSEYNQICREFKVKAKNLLKEVLNQQDETLNLVPTDRKHTLIANKKGNIYEFNIYMQGENETVFFDL